jgi:kynurenine formamidase
MTGYEPLRRRAYSREEFKELARSVRTWGRWGPDDECGAANRITPETVLAAAATVRAGRRLSLALPLDRQGPQPGNRVRVNPQHVMTRLPSHTPEHRTFVAADAVYMPLQAATQWDALAHVFYRGQAYNGRGPETVTSAGAAHNSISALGSRGITRGVLLDVPGSLGREYLEPGEAIQDDDLQHCAAAQGVEVRAADLVMVRTGHLGRRRGRWGDFVAGDAPGLGVSAARWLCEREVAAVATDTWAVEVFPHEVTDVLYPVHVVLLVNAGIHLGEIWVLDELARDCAADGVYECLVSAPPLAIIGAVGSPLNPVAIK